MPPMELRTTASSRNCVRMCRLLAPTAMRMPISRVRSVTDTSMMFIMPMPPTSSEIPGDTAEQDRHHPRRALRRFGDVRRIAHREVIVATIGDAVALAR